ncbi:MAG: peptidyl-prolyl cis-trans isomerase, partial [Algicola sp.]|nr:peptidyl-prolyl cis-trans isomerase [Algicola sp.]
PSLILEHLFYREIPAQPIHELVSQTDKMQLKGDFHTMLGSRIDGITEDELSSIIGLLAAQQIFQQPLSQWSQAIKSDSGYHFVKIEQRLPLATTSFDEARDYIKSDWLKLQQERLVDDKVSKLQAKYQIHWIEDAVASQIDPQS